MAESDPRDEETHQPTLAGCLLTVLSLAIIFALALPVVRWRDPETGEPLPRGVAVLLPVLAGALLYGLGSALLVFLGIPVLKRKKEMPGYDDQLDGP